MLPYKVLAHHPQHGTLPKYAYKRKTRKHGRLPLENRRATNGILRTLGNYLAAIFWSGGGTMFYQLCLIILFSLACCSLLTGYSRRNLCCSRLPKVPAGVRPRVSGSAQLFRRLVPGSVAAGSAYSPASCVSIAFSLRRSNEPRRRGESTVCCWCTSIQKFTRRRRSSAGLSCSFAFGCGVWRE
jgi:hypothetical protein